MSIPNEKSVEDLEQEAAVGVRATHLLAIAERPQGVIVQIANLMLEIHPYDVEYMKGLRDCLAGSLATCNRSIRACEEAKKRLKPRF